MVLVQVMVPQEGLAAVVGVVVSVDSVAVAVVIAMVDSAAAAGAMQISVYLHVFAVSSSDPGGAHSLAVGHWASTRRRVRYISKLWRNLPLSCSAVQHPSNRLTSLAEDIF